LAYRYFPTQEMLWAEVALFAVGGPLFPAVSESAPMSEGERLLVSYLRESNIDSTKHAWAILALLVKALRQRWPEVKIILRTDSGFCRWRMFRWCERAGVKYIVGLAKNERLNTLSAKLQKRAERKYRRSGLKVRLFSQFKYKAKTWDKKRRVIAKAEYSARVPIRAMC
jgi:hypothetical protein